MKVFHTLDSLGDGNGTLDVEDVKHAFDARSSPNVIAGRKSEREVLHEFVGAFEGSSGNRDGVVTFEEWIRYDEEDSGSIETDEAFGAMVVSVWTALKTLDASGREVPVIRYTSERAINALEMMLRAKIWRKTCARARAPLCPRRAPAVPGRPTYAPPPPPPPPPPAPPPARPGRRTQHARQERAQGARGCVQAVRHGRLAPFLLFVPFSVSPCLSFFLSIKLAEFAKAMERFGLYASPEEIGGLFSRYDTDSDGVCLLYTSPSPRD